jgi:predicted membrane protein
MTRFELPFNAFCLTFCSISWTHFCAIFFLLFFMLTVRFVYFVFSYFGTQVMSGSFMMKEDENEANHQHEYIAAKRSGTSGNDVSGQAYILE